MIKMKSFLLKNRKKMFKTKIFAIYFVQQCKDALYVAKNEVLTQFSFLSYKPFGRRRWCIILKNPLAGILIYYKCLTLKFIPVKTF